MSENAQASERRNGALLKDPRYDKAVAGLLALLLSVMSTGAWWAFSEMSSKLDAVQATLVEVRIEMAGAKGESARLRADIDRLERELSEHLRTHVAPKAP